MTWRVSFFEVSDASDNLPEFSRAEIAIICARHNGEVLHTEAVESLLSKYDISIEKLICGAHWSMHQETMISQVRSMNKPHKILST